MTKRNSNIPQIVRDCTWEDATIKYIGKYDGDDAYYSCFPDQTTGFPDVILIHNGKAVPFNGFLALDIADYCMSSEKQREKKVKPFIFGD